MATTKDLTSYNDWARADYMSLADMHEDMAMANEGAALLAEEDLENAIASIDDTDDDMAPEISARAVDAHIYRAAAEAHRKAAERARQIAAMQRRPATKEPPHAD